VEWAKGQHVKLEANDQYFQGKPGVDLLTFKLIPEAFTRISALLTGDIHIAINVPPDMVPQVEDSGLARITSTAAGMLTVRMQFNTVKPGPFQDVRVRQAVNHTVDMDSLVENILGSYAERLPFPLERAAFGFNPDLKSPTVDLEKAKELLAEAGYPDGFEFTMYTCDGRYMMDKTISEAIASELAKVGIIATVEPLEWRVYLERTAKREVEGMYLLGFGGGRFDADTIFDQFHSSRTYSTFSNPEIDEVLLATRSEMDPEKRKQLLFQAQDMLMEDPAFCCTYAPKAIFGVRNEVLGWNARFGEVTYLWTAYFQ